MLRVSLQGKGFTHTLEITLQSQPQPEPVQARRECSSLRLLNSQFWHLCSLC